MNKEQLESILDRLDKIEDMIEYLRESLKDIRRRVVQLEELV